MKQNLYIYTIILFLFFGLFTFTYAQEKVADPFVTPDNLKDNVAFWKKIYTEVSLSDGLIHDREFPGVVYKKITIGKLRGSKRRQTIRKHINLIVKSLKIITGKKQSQWGEKERAIMAMFKPYGGLKKIKSARSRIRFQQGQKERFKLGLERSGAYMPYIKKIFKQYKIPLRIAFLPHVESSFDITAYSKVGAAGMWQFMRRTGRMFLKINYKVDERRDPFFSTVAAAKLLKMNFDSLKAWPLAITAYNHGLPSMMRAVRKTKSRDIGVIIKKYKNRRFKFASKNFYGCFLAASEIAANPQKYFKNLNYHTPVNYNEVILKNYIRPAVLAKHLGISQKELKKLNASLRPTVFRRQLSIPRGFRLRLPPALSAKAAIQKITAIPGSLKQTKSADFHYYRVKKGDTIYGISRRFRIPGESLLASNNIGHRNRIYIGQVLRIPGKNKKKKNHTPPKQTKPTVKSTAKPTVKPTAEPKSEAIKTERVKPISNRIESHPIPPNQKDSPFDTPNSTNYVEMKEAEALPNPAQITRKDSEAAFDATLYNLDVKLYPGKGTARVRVAVNETLGHFADWLQVSTYRIRGLNRLGRRGLKSSQKLVLPLTEKSLESFNAKRLEYHMALEEDFFNRYIIWDVREQKVRYGETLWSICNEDEIPLWLFKKYNRTVHLEKIKVNTPIRIPVIKNK
ncbi:MAG: transglycosylase SLT domain-containing protein [bacterium]|nr:transglycosylase SLT domain-containing protein [bacterium]